MKLFQGRSLFKGEVFAHKPLGKLLHTSRLNVLNCFEKIKIYKHNVNIFLRYGPTMHYTNKELRGGNNA